MKSDHDAQPASGSATPPSLAATRTNSVRELAGASFFGALLAGVASVVFLQLSLPPTDGAYGGRMFGPADMVLPVMMSGVFIGTLIAFPISWCLLRRVHLPHATFVTYGVVLVTLGVLFPFFSMLAVPIAFVTMVAAMLYCRRRFPFLPECVGDKGEGWPPIPKTVFRVIAIPIVLVILGYAASAAWPDPDFDLLEAARSGDAHAARQALQSGADPNCVGSWSDTPLTVATAREHAEIVFLLLEEGATIDRTGRSEDTPLITAAKRGNTELVRFLLERGADPDLKNRHGKTARDSAMELGHTTIVELLPPNAR